MIQKSNKKGDILQRFINFFQQKIILKLQNFNFLELPYKSRECSDERNYLLLNFIKNRYKIILDPGGTFGMGVNILANFPENRM